MSEFILSEELKKNIQQEIDKNPFVVLSKVIYDQIYNEIIAGHLRPEHTIVESKIAKDLNVSRSPVKAALNDMICAGILAKDSGRGLHVKLITYEECYWIYEARMALEPKAAYLAAKRINKEELMELRALIEKFEEIDVTKDQLLYTKTDKKFHEVIIRASRNQYLVNMYKSIECPLACYRNQLNQLAYEEAFQQNGMENGSDHHRYIYQMIRGHYPLMAEDEMRNDIRRMFGTMSRLKN